MGPSPAKTAGSGLQKNAARVAKNRREKMATVAVPNKTKLVGGSFLIDEHSTDQVFTPEDLSEEHQQIARTTEEFAKNEILPNVEKIEHKDFSVTRELLRKACEIGIANVDIPEQYGGSDMDKISSALINEHISVSGSFSVSFGGHGRADCRLCSLRIDLGFGRYERPHQGRALARRKGVDPERRKDVDHQRRF